jgi:hypothetical protein
MIKLSYYKTNVGLFLKAPFSSAYPYGKILTGKWRINQTITDAPENGGFYYLAGVTSIDTLERKTPGRKNHIGFKLKESVPESVAAALEPYYTVKEAGYCWREEDDDYGFSPEFTPISSLYDPVYEAQEEGWEKTEFEREVLGELEVTNYNKPEAMTVDWHINPGIEGKTVDLSSIVKYSDIELMLTPGFMLHTRPCSLTGDQVYKIVRAHIIENIDNRHARITSNYDFCFAVSKRVSIRPVITKTEEFTTKGKSYSTPRFKTTTVTHKEIPIFEMTPPSQKYRDYTPIKGWQADSLEDMATQVRAYLDALMEEINRPLRECPHCEGTGHVIPTIETNKRLK